MVIEVSLYPMVPGGIGAMYVEIFRIFTEHKFPGFFDRNSVKLKFPFSFDRK